MAWALPILVLVSLAGPTVSQVWGDAGHKALIHEHASAKRASGGGSISSGAVSREKCCTIAMFLGTMEMPKGGETEQLGTQALSCCREVLCSKFQTAQDCAWISSGDDTWKRDLGNDLDRVEYIEKRLKELGTNDFGDPDAQDERARLTREQAAIEKREMAQLKKVSPLTGMCDAALDDAIDGQDAESLQEARVDCVTLFVQIASGSCAWEPRRDQCESVAPQGGGGASSLWPTITVVTLIAGILGVTYYAARPAAVAEAGDNKGEYSELG
uniref:Uncharacterized protein n=1 Tax=Hemiselmis tepida TaxID=464990 RepID=A0A7S0YZV1_9CRYP|mmetsp:Transcript_34116/g.87474  ORF Transcript_34116/g.87474 Transcript_34116/m.87474 type:complete len:271 (+) Transcript_34116:1-813(+)